MSADRVPSPETTDLRTRIARVIFVVGVVTLTVYGWRHFAGTPEDPPPDQPEQPVQPIAHSDLVGTARCAECHPGQADSHARSGHARTFSSTRDSAIAQTLCTAKFPEADGYGPYDYECDEHGLLVGLFERFGGKLFPLDYAFGSGDHAITFLTLLSDQQGETIGVEHRATWYRHSGELGVTPGQQDRVPEREIEHFGRVFEQDVVLRCISCHTTTFELIDHKLHNVVGGVQCEACHGPGRDHAAAAQAGDLAKAVETIQRPRDTASDIALCGRCHRMPEEFDQDRLARYPPSLVRFQPVGLLRSRCYLESERSLGCLDCHDPHVHSSEVSRQTHEQNCLRCHSAPDHSHCSVSSETGCIDCHMPAMEIIPGISFHDHWIRVRNPDEETVPPGRLGEDDDHAG